ncbi:MAG: EAL domain-containing protein [Gammaproteobacteria bacterium]|nr:EAL domain-containing protein [Gammaproteobacteria bacterium]
MAVETALRLLIIEESANDANAYITALRGGGFSVRSHIMSESDNPDEIISAHQPDIVLLSYSNSILSLSLLTKKLEASKISASVIVMAGKPDQVGTAEVIMAGARDRVLKKDLKHLKAVVKREFEHVSLLQKQYSIKSLYEESEARCQILMENSRDAIAYVHQGMHVYANAAYLEMFGIQQFDDIEGLPIMDLVAPAKQESFKQFLRNLEIKKGEAKPELETELKSMSNETFTGRMEFSLASIEGEPCTQIIIRQEADVSELEEQINQLSRQDPLTGLLNRPAYLEEFSNAIANVDKKGKQYCLFQVGIDDFKTIQNTVGLVGSDQIIAEVASVIKKCLDATDLAGRYEGSRYLVLLATGSETVIHKKAGAIIKAIENHICEVGGKSIHVKALIGASIIDDSSLEVNEIMSRTDKALSHAKHDNKERFSIYQPKEGEMSQKQLDAAWIKRLKTAMDKKRFHLLFQPIVQLDGGEMERYEVFMDMRDEKDERVPTSEFMPAAERTKMSKVLDRWVIGQALQHLTVQKKTHPNTVFFIKLTGGSLEDMELFRWISEKIRPLDLLNWSLIFEVKEEAVVSHLKQAQAFATLLKTIHCGFAIDDFGKGPDPFKLVDLVPAQYLKFHKDFANDLASNTHNQETLRDITEKARALKKNTIVQHVEDASTLSVLWTIGANFTQGNFFQGATEKIDYDFSSGIA